MMRKSKNNNRQENPKVAELNAEQWADKYARLLAEFDNYRKRTRQQQARQAEESRREFIGELLEVVDNFERALESEGLADDPHWHGMQAIDRQLRGLLEKHGVRPLPSRGQPFDPALHEAIGARPAAEGEQPGTVAEEVQPGWMAGEEVLRPARVIVAQAPDPATGDGDAG